MRRVIGCWSLLAHLFAAVLLTCSSVVWPAPLAPFASAREMPVTPDLEAAVTPAAEYVPDQVLVRFRSVVALDNASQLLAAQGLSVIDSIKPLRIHLLHLPPKLSVPDAVATLSKLPEVEFAEPNYIMHVAGISDPGLAKNQWAPQTVGAPQAWLTTEGDPAVVIAVVDTGVDYRHHELAPNMWTNNDEVPGNGLDDDQNGRIDDVLGWDFVNSDADPLDDHFHGTHVAGIAAAAPSDDPAGLVGICPRCRIMPVKVMNAQGSGTLDTIANGFTYAADNGARVINASLGGTAGSATLESAVNYAWSRGVVVVAAAGNNGTNTRIYPAGYANAMAVAASNSADYRSCFSNYADGYISVAAPGELIYSTTPRDAAGTDTYATYSGTSMATPHVAGLAGLLISQDPGRSNSLVRVLIESTAQDLGSVGQDAHFGAGRISAARAVLGDTSPTFPPAGLFAGSPLATGYAHARKLIRDNTGQLHLVWHDQSGGQYQVLYATSIDGTTWTAPSPVFSSSAETYNPAVATDGTTLYVAFPSKDGSARYRVFFTSKSLAPGTSWATPVPIMGGTYHAVRPDLSVDSTTGRLHLVASSFDDTGDVYYAASGDRGLTWDTVRQVNLALASGQFTRYATVHANGNHVYIAGRTTEPRFFGLLADYRAVTVRSMDGGASWDSLTEHAKSTSAEHGVAMAGGGDDLYLAYEHNGSIYVRQGSSGQAWGISLNLGQGSWPSISLGSDAKAWVAWESGGSLLLLRLSPGATETPEKIITGTSLCKVFYPNLKLGTGAGRVEWVTTACPGSPYNIVYGGRALSDWPVSPPVQFSAAGYAANENGGSAAVSVTLSSATTRPVTVTYSTINGTATAGTDYTSASGTLVFAPGETSKVFSVTIKEDTLDEPDETVLLRLGSFINGIPGTPQDALLVINDNDAPPTVSLLGSSFYATESAGSASVSVRLSAASGYTVTVGYATSNGTAGAGSDYTASSGTLTFNPGQTLKSIAIPLIDDSLPEPNETLAVTLSNPANAVLGATQTGTVTISANDSVSFSSSSYYVHEYGVVATVTVRLNSPSALPVTVNYSSSDGTATNGADYAASSGTLTFNPGETSKGFTVPIVDDTLPEPNETMKLTLSNPTNAGLGSPYTSTLTINANDALSLLGSSLYNQENSGLVTITVKLSGPASLPVTVDYAATDGTAVAGSDYVATAGTLTFSPGQTIKAFAVPVIDDASPEPNETINLRLSNPSNAVLAAPSSAVLTIWSNDAVNFSIGSMYVQESAGVATITVRMNAPSSGTVTVDYATSDSTAIAGADYVATSGTLVFTPGQTSRTFTVSIVDDVLKESAETIRLTLSNVTNAGMGSPSTATLTIQAND